MVLTLAHLRSGVLLAGLLGSRSSKPGWADVLHAPQVRAPQLHVESDSAVVITVVLMDHFWLDAFRLLHQRLSAP